MKENQLVCKDLDSLGILQFENFLQGDKVFEIGRVDGRWNAINGMSDYIMEKSRNIYLERPFLALSCPRYHRS